MHRIFGTKLIRSRRYNYINFDLAQPKGSVVVADFKCKVDICLKIVAQS